MACGASKNRAPALREQCEELKRDTTTAICFSEEFFNDDDAKAKYYTGLHNFPY